MILLLAAAGDLDSSEGGAGTTAGVIKLVLGLLFLVLAFRNWHGRSRDGEQAEMPKWMAAIDEFTAPKSFGLAFLLSGVNPKNLGLTLAAAVTIASGGLATGEQIIVLAVFIFLASVTVAGPALVYAVVGHRAEEPLEGAKDWLVANNKTIMAVVLLVIGAKLIGDAIALLSG